MLHVAASCSGCSLRIKRASRLATHLQHMLHLAASCSVLQWLQSSIKSCVMTNDTLTTQTLCCSVLQCVAVCAVMDLNVRQDTGHSYKRDNLVCHRCSAVMCDKCTAVGVACGHHRSVWLVDTISLPINKFVWTASVFRFIQPIFLDLPHF